METFKKFLIILATFVTLSGSSCSDCIDGFKEKNAEIKALEAEIKAQKGVRYADLEFAEQQAGAYRGCAFGFDTCPQSTAENGKISNQNGFFGVSSLWFFAIVFAKFGVIAALISIMLWLPMHLLVKFTKPLQGEIEAANLLISEAQTRAGAATARQIEAERLATLAEAKAQGREPGGGGYRAPQGSGPRGRTGPPRRPGGAGAQESRVQRPGRRDEPALRVHRDHSRAGRGRGGVGA